MTNTEHMVNMTTEKLETYVKAIDIYESEEAKWLRDKHLEQGGLIARLNPDMTKIVLLVEEAKGQIGAESVEIARALVKETKAHQKLREAIGKLRDWNNEKREYMINRYEEYGDQKFEQYAASYELAADSLTNILE